MTAPLPSPLPEQPWKKSYPVDIDWNSDIPLKTVPAMFEEAVARYPDRECLSFMGRTWTYRETGDMVNRFAQGLQEQGIGKGSRVGLCLPNTPFYAVAYYGAMKAGATVVNFNPLYAESEIEQQVNDSGADLMVTVNVRQVQSKVEKMLGKTCLRKIIACDLAEALPSVKGTAFRAINAAKGVLGKADTMKIRRDAAHIAFSDLLKNEGKPAPVSVQPDDLAVLQYTGGTTGVPKAAMLTHGNLTANVRQAKLWFTAGKETEKQERMLAVLPFFHVFSMTAQLNLSMEIGAALIMLPRFELKSLLQTIDKEKPTIFAGVPTIYKAIADNPKTAKYDLSSLKICMSGGAPLPENIYQDWKKLTGVELVEGYGLSETSPLVTANPVHGRKQLNSVGLVMPKTEIKFASLEADGPDAPLQGEGELCFRGPQVMKGYWNRPDETAKVMDTDGFLHTGDVGYMDTDGYVYIVSRIKDMIIASGLKVYPRKVEDAILEHPGVSEVMVAGVSDAYRGENVKAWVVMKEGQSFDAAAMKAFLKDKLAPYEIPKLYEQRDSLPKTLIGKPDRKALLAEESAKLQNAKPAAPKPPGR